MDNMVDDRYLQKLRKDVKESIDFFSNQHKPERERCVVRAFFRCLGVPFMEKDLLVNQPEPIDVAALGGRFQVTEVLDQDRRRHDEYKKRLEKLKEILSFQKLFEPWQNPDPVPWSDVVGWVRKRLSHKAPHADIDALVYINLHHTFLHADSAEPTFSDVAKLGWRSVSVVYLPYSVVMSAADNAPDYIRSGLGLARNAWTRPDGWFEPGM